MKYTTNDLSKILNVSTNTIRRYEEKGFLHAIRNENNGYREFDITDVEKLMYTNKYRKIGFSQESITEIFSVDVHERLKMFSDKLEDIDKQIENLKSIRHMLKDDVELLHRIEDFGDSVKEYPSCGMHYILYQDGGSINLGKDQTKAIHTFLEKCPEYEYAYYFKKDSYQNEELIYSEGIVANELMTKKYNVDTQPPVKYYSPKRCLMRVVRLPLNITSFEMITESELKEILFGQFKTYMKENNLELMEDVVGIKLGLSQEDGEAWQYVLMHVPVKEKNRQ